MPGRFCADIFASGGLSPPACHIKGDGALETVMVACSHMKV